MFCKKCGNQLPDGAMFCSKCGTKQDVSEVIESVTPVNADSEASVAKLPQVKIKPQVLLIGVAALVVLILAIIIGNTLGNTINLDKYVLIESEGYDGYGRVEADVDWEAINEKYGDKLSKGMTPAALEEYGGFAFLLNSTDILQDAIHIEIEPNDNLSNGDELEYTWDVDEDLLKAINGNIKFKYKGGSYKVENLEKIETFDAFKDIALNFNGIAPNGSVNVEYTGEELSYYDFEIDKTGDLSNGDKVTVTISDDAAQRCAENYGRIPAELVKEYTVEGLESYLSAIGEVDADALVSMQNQAEDVFSSRRAKEWSDESTLESFTYLGNYLLTSKDSSAWGGNNMFYLIYKAQIRNVFNGKKGSYNDVTDLYWYIRYDNLMVGSDGKVKIDVTRYYIPGNRIEVDSGVSEGWWDKSWYFYGYDSLDSLYKDVVISNLDIYNAEEDINESVAPQTVEETPAPEELSEGDYILPNSDSELITKRDLEGLSAEECKIARNEIYARHGRRFKDDELQEYFNSKSWYEGTIDPDDFAENILSDIEIQNKDVIVEFEKENGYR